MSETLRQNDAVRTMTVGYLKYSRRTAPYIRIVNNYLSACGFKCGDKVSVEYKRDRLTITRKEATI